ncbi:hypothetical protein TIFTF001_015851 [Ficus carica]|uniref:Uncharacterized protein n=1 Tax=Ficus carica TaxID=3494 RepID=A0AA88A6E9_FICCA|nr:hypothetical protein TIFTF001_015851 [Ficus carica]
MAAMREEQNSLDEEVTYPPRSNQLSEQESSAESPPPKDL